MWVCGGRELWHTFQELFDSLAKPSSPSRCSCTLSNAFQVFHGHDIVPGTIIVFIRQISSLFAPFTWCPSWNRSCVVIGDDLGHGKCCLGLLRAKIKALYLQPPGEHYSKEKGISVPSPPLVVPHPREDGPPPPPRGWSPSDGPPPPLGDHTPRAGRGGEGARGSERRRTDARSCKTVLPSRS